MSCDIFVSIFIKGVWTFTLHSFSAAVYFCRTLQPPCYSYVIFYRWVIAYIEGRLYQTRIILSAQFPSHCTLLYAGKQGLSSESHHSFCCYRWIIMRDFRNEVYKSWRRTMRSRMGSCQCTFHTSGTKSQSYSKTHQLLSNITEISSSRTLLSGLEAPMASECQV